MLPARYDVGAGQGQQRRFCTQGGIMNVTTRKQDAGKNYQIVNVYVGGKTQPPRSKWPILRAWRELTIWFIAGGAIAHGLAILLA
jgi:hypothetical protein